MPRGHVACKEWTVWEMVATLLDARWQWVPLPAKMADRAHLEPHVSTAPGVEVVPEVFYVNRNICRAYWLCLLSWPQLYELGLRRLHHGHKSELYIKLLEGELIEFPPLRPRQRMNLDVEPPPQARRFHARNEGHRRRADNFFADEDMNVGLCDVEGHDSEEEEEEAPPHESDEIAANLAMGVCKRCHKHGAKTWGPNMFLGFSTIQNRTARK